ncbi:hypothetical protein San01_25290 [Streptomyces angustmyceticus]|uniref:Uncharacterized protein n=1 Tax=Streptomyces angustmyceticus TaxID=285578 RepID=A0A5J4LD18_9ACTN|nr:hypothetical protein San01_25290 [Streptomyces angustmyceticus]
MSHGHISNMSHNTSPEKGTWKRAPGCFRAPRTVGPARGVRAARDDTAEARRATDGSGAGGAAHAPVRVSDRGGTP